ncbi:MAG: hypothetical protein MUE46_20820, partial [Xanthomonadales bacterium]|nr:hypothetical protein [Xanthomonadales bacterium]
MTPALFFAAVLAATGLQPRQGRLETQAAGDPRTGARDFEALSDPADRIDHPDFADDPGPRHADPARPRRVRARHDPLCP